MFRPAPFVRSWAAGAALCVGLLSFPSAAQAARFTVGPHGDYFALQPAIDAALAAGGANEIRVEAGTLVGSMKLLAPELGTLRITGGWLPGFLDRSPLRIATTLDAAGVERALNLRCASGAVFIEGFELLHGVAAADSGFSDAVAGGGAFVRAHGTCSATLAAVAIRDSAATTAVLGTPPPANAFAEGGGAWIDVGDDAHLVLSGVTVENNHASSHAAAGGAAAGGISVAVFGRGRLAIASLDVRGNRAESPVYAAPGGLWLIQGDDSIVTVHDLDVRDNTLIAPGGNVPAARFEIGLRDSEPCPCTMRLEVRAARFENNHQAPYDHLAQTAVEFSVGQQASVVLSDAIVARGDNRGLTVTVRDEATVALVNLTVTAYPDLGIEAHALDAASISIANTISYGNAPNLYSTSAVELVDGTNLIGVDPRFRDPLVDFDYRPGAGSLAIDGGTEAPPGGLGLTDVDGQPRRHGEAPDIGAHETTEGSLCSVIPDRPVSSSVPACRCFRDPGLPTHRCGFFLPDLFVELRFPIPAKIGDPLRFDLLIAPWTRPIGPFDLGASLLVGGKEIPLPKPPVGVLFEGLFAARRVSTTLPAGTVTLRTHLRYLPPGSSQPVEATLEALIPKP